MKKISSILFLLVCFSSYAQETNKRYNISFHSCLDVDSNEISVIHPVRNEFRFSKEGNNIFSLRCADIALAPDTHDLYTYYRQSVQLADSLNNDTLKVIKVSRVYFDNDFQGLMYHFRINKADDQYDHIKVTAYSHGEMFGDFIFHHFSNDSLSSDADSALLAQLFKNYRVSTMEDIRKENKAIRDRYQLKVDSLPYDNYWIQIGRENGMMVRDTIRMADLDSVQYKPRFTYYNITYKGLLSIEPPLQHEVQEFVLDGLKSLEDQNGNYLFEVRDTQRGKVNKQGKIIVKNSIGYPLELSFHFNYHNSLIDILHGSE